MSDQDAFLTGTIDDYLLGIADGVHKAQQKLSQMSLVLQKDEAPITYQIPRVDFELKLSFEMVTSEHDTAAKELRFKPSSGKGGRSRTATTEATSTIKGALVAVPRLGGKPQPIIRTTLKRTGERQMEVRVTVTSAAGESLSGVPVHFNVDREKSRSLTEGLTRGQDLFPEGTNLHPLPGTRFWDGVVETDAEGLATGVFEPEAGEPAGKYVAAIVDVLDQTETILIQLR